MHGTLVDQSGQPGRFMKRPSLGRDLRQSPFIEDCPVADVAMLNSYENRWATHAQRHHRDFDYVAHFNHYYRPLAASCIAIDV